MTSRGSGPALGVISCSDGNRSAGSPNAARIRPRQMDPVVLLRARPLAPTWMVGAGGRSEGGGDALHDEVNMSFLEADMGCGEWRRPVVGGVVCGF